MASLMHLVAPTREFSAVFADDDGNPVFEPIVAIGIYDFPDGKSLPAGLSMGKHIEPADLKENFVGYADCGDTAGDWTERCQQKRKELKHQARLAEREAKNGTPKIIVPNAKSIIEPWDKEMGRG